VTAIAVPEGLTDRQVRDHCREHYGVMISGGQGAGNLVRIGHMGPTAASLYPVLGLAAVGQTLADLGVTVDIGAGAEAALEVLSARGATMEPAA
jgi:pyridoxamine--pyruvate transaminase